MDQQDTQAQYEKEIIEQLTRKVTAPLESASIREFFENKDLFYVINYSQSKIKGPQFLIYATNLDLPCDVEFDLPMSYDEYSEIMKAFMKQTSITRMSLLQVMAAQLLLAAKGIPAAEQHYSTPASDEFINRFIEENEELVASWLHFFDSTPVYAIKAIERLRDYYMPHERFEVIDDRTAVGPNVATLFNIPDFIGLYFTTGKYKMSYYKQQFEEYIFKGSNLAPYFDVKNNLAAILFTYYANGAFTPEEIESDMFKIGVFSPEMNIPPYVYDPNYTLESTDVPTENAVQDGQPIVDQTVSGNPVSPEPESGTAEGV